MADYYDELCGESSEEEEENGDSDEDSNVVEEYNIPEEEANTGIRREHRVPVLKWLTE